MPRPRQVAEFKKDDERTDRRANRNGKLRKLTRDKKNIYIYKQKPISNKN